MLNKIEYQKSFKNGLNEVIYSDNPENLSEPEVDYTDISSIGYYDGFQYGDYCVRTGQQNAIKPEHLIAVIDKAFNRSVDIYNNAISNQDNTGPRVR